MSLTPTRTIADLDELMSLVAEFDGLLLRYSAGPDA
jgi:hypothetical protein